MFSGVVFRSVFKHFHLKVWGQLIIIIYCFLKEREKDRNILIVCIKLIKIHSKDMYNVTKKSKIIFKIHAVLLNFLIIK